MKFWGYALSALSALALLSPQGAHSTDLSGRLTAAAEVRDSSGGGKDSQLFLSAYASARKIADVQGLNFKLYGRLASESEDEDQGLERESSLYLAYLEKLDLVKGLDLKAGRQFAAFSAGARTIDGVDLRYQAMSNLALRTFLGNTVDTNVEEGSDATAFGLEARTRFEGFEASLSYYGESEKSNTLKELYGADFRWEAFENTEFSGEASYDYLRDQFSHLYLEADYYAKQPFGVRLHYLYDMPVFEATSIYSVFAADLYEEVGCELTYRLGWGYTALARYTREFYESYSDADTIEAGLKKERGTGWSGYLLGTLREDDGGQSLKGMKFLFTYPVHRYFEPGVGINYDVLERRIEDTEDTTAKRYWVFARSEVSDTLSFDLTIENGKSVLTGNYTQGRLAANYRF